MNLTESKFAVWLEKRTDYQGIGEHLYKTQPEQFKEASRKWNRGRDKKQLSEIENETQN